jgi:ParB-like nuclease domain
VHFDRVGSGDTPSSGHRRFAADELLGRDDLERHRRDEREDDRDDDLLDGGQPLDGGEPPARQGLPPRFKMRHTRHYVDEVLGDTPLRTVREIPVTEIELPEQTEQLEAFDSFESSIRQFGVLEPLLVVRGGRSGDHYRVIAGMRRLRAAHRVGLGTVPCLVHDVDDDKLNDLREAARQRLTAASATRPVENVEPATLPDRNDDVSLDPLPDLGAQSIDLVSTLLPMSDAALDRLRCGVLTELAGIELLRAKTETAASHIIAETNGIERAPVDCGSLIAGVIEGVASEARFRGVRIDVTIGGADGAVSLDAAQCRTALTGLVQGLLAMAPRDGTLLAIHAHVTQVRPAFIVQCMLKESGLDLETETLKRFFDAEWTDHPAGKSSAKMLAAAAKVAALHGGRVDVQQRAPKGCVAIFVVPRPLTDV